MQTSLSRVDRKTIFFQSPVKQLSYIQIKSNDNLCDLSSTSFFFFNLVLIFLFPLIYFPGDLLIKIENLDKRLLASILSTVQDSDSKVDDAIGEKTAAPQRPFQWYNYLQQERPIEYSTFNEFIQKLHSGNFKIQVVSPNFPNTGDFKLENLRGKMLTLNSIIFFIILNQLCRKPAQILFFTAIAAILTLCTSICDQVARHLLCCYPS